MKFNYEKFAEKSLMSGMADEFVSVRYKNEEKKILKQLEELSDLLKDSLTEEQQKILEKISDLEIEHEGIVEKQSFYKGYMLARSFFTEDAF